MSFRTRHLLWKLWWVRGRRWPRRFGFTRWGVCVPRLGMLYVATDGQYRRLMRGR